MTGVIFTKIHARLPTGTCFLGTDTPGGVSSVRHQILWITLLHMWTFKDYPQKVAPFLQDFIDGKICAKKILPFWLVKFCFCHVLTVLEICGCTS